MLNKNKTERLVLDGKTLVYRFENGYYWVFCPQTTEFYRFNQQGFAILIGISIGSIDTEVALRIKKSKTVKNFLYYLIEQNLINEQSLRELNLLGERNN